MPKDPRGEPLAGDALDRHALGWLERINAAGTTFMSPSLLDGRWMVRVPIGIQDTTREHVARLWELGQRSALVD